ncbi:MAG: hypothetical protein WBQ86_02040, partial [Candidatus Binatus sp.]
MALERVTGYSERAAQVGTGSASMKWNAGTRWAWGDELFGLTLADLACYNYFMTNSQNAQHPPTPPGDHDCRPQQFLTERNYPW